MLCFEALVHVVKQPCADNGNEVTFFMIAEVEMLIIDINNVLPVYMKIQWVHLQQHHNISRLARSHNHTMTQSHIPSWGHTIALCPCKFASICSSLCNAEASSHNWPFEGVSNLKWRKWERLITYSDGRGLHFLCDCLLHSLGLWYCAMLPYLHALHD